MGGLSECSNVQAASPAGAGVDEYLIKAAFVCKFTLYVEWPPQAFTEPDGPLVIGFLGPEVVAQALAHSAADMAVQGRTIVVRRLARGESLAGVHVLYVTGNPGASAGELLANARGRPLLTVTEQAQDWTPALSAINFTVVDDKVRFDVSLPAADASNLKISARLLGVARKVIARPL